MPDSTEINKLNLAFIHVEMTELALLHTKIQTAGQMAFQLHTYIY